MLMILTLGDVEAASQKNPGEQGWANPSTPSRTSLDPVPTKQYVPGVHAYGRSVVSFRNGSEVLVKF